MTRRIFTRLPGNIRTGVPRNKLRCHKCVKMVEFDVARRLPSLKEVIVCAECGEVIKATPKSKE